MVCFLFITPLAAISGWLCLRGAQDHLQLGSWLQAMGLIALTIALFTIYVLWTLVKMDSRADHTRALLWRRWVLSESAYVEQKKFSSVIDLLFLSSPTWLSVQVSFRYHCQLYSEWRRTNQKVRLLIPEAKESNSSQHSLLSTKLMKKSANESIV